MIPDGYQSLSPISDILTTIIGESDQVPITEIAGSIALNEDSCKITEEADTTVEHTIKNKLPNLPESNLQRKKIEAYLY